MKSAIETVIERYEELVGSATERGSEACAELADLLGYVGHKADCRIGELCREIGGMDFMEHPCDCGLEQFLERFKKEGSDDLVL